MLWASSANQEHHYHVQFSLDILGDIDNISFGLKFEEATMNNNNNNHGD